MNKLLDKGRPEASALTAFPKLKAVLYLLIMLFGQMGFEYWFFRALSVYSIRPVLMGIGLPLLISAGLEVIRWWWHRRKEKRLKQAIPRDPLWFQWIEGTMAIWVLFQLWIVAQFYFR